ncbi:MAG TPA: DinB family protein [Candidatus Limnocylindrales bacterium]
MSGDGDNGSGIGARPNRAAVVERLASAPERLETAARLAAVAVAAAGGTGGEWSPVENVRHLIAVEGAVWHGRLRALELAEPGIEPRWAWAEPTFDDGPADRSLEEVLATFAGRRFATIAMLAALDDAGWARTGIHATYGRLDVSGLMRTAADHDDEHIETLKRLGR